MRNERCVTMVFLTSTCVWFKQVLGDSSDAQMVQAEERCKKFRETTSATAKNLFVALDGSTPRNQATRSRLLTSVEFSLAHLLTRLQNPMPPKA